MSVGMTSNCSIWAFSMIVLAVVFEPSVSSYVYPRRHLCRVLGKTFISCNSYKDVARQNAVGGSLQPDTRGARD